MLEALSWCDRATCQDILKTRGQGAKNRKASRNQKGSASESPLCFRVEFSGCLIYRCPSAWIIQRAHAFHVQVQNPLLACDKHRFTDTSFRELSGSWGWNSTAQTCNSHPLCSILLGLQPGAGHTIRTAPPSHRKAGYIGYAAASDSKRLRPSKPGALHWSRGSRK